MVVLLEDDCSLPSVEISSENLSISVQSKLNDLLFQSSEDYWGKKVFSSIENDSDSIRVCFNIFLTNRRLSKKPMVGYNKNSIDLQRFMNHTRK